MPASTKVPAVLPSPPTARLWRIVTLLRVKTACKPDTSRAKVPIPPPKAVPTNWKLVPYREELGAYQYTIQDTSDTLFLDDRGLTNFQSSQVFGNFAHSSISGLIRTWLNTQRTKAVASCVVRDKNQYRLFFSDQYALYVTMNRNKAKRGR